MARTDINIGAVIKALQQKNLLQILAEPNLIAVNGKEASFLAGGEFPFPIVQPGAGLYRGHDLVQGIRRAVEIYSRDHAQREYPFESGAVGQRAGFRQCADHLRLHRPALSTRKAETEFELQDGQSFVIAGLIDNRVTDLYNKIPGLGDIPILGNFFRSKSAQRSNSELMVLCTAHRISASAQAPPLPVTPKPYMDKEQVRRQETAGTRRSNGSENGMTCVICKL